MSCCENHKCESRPWVRRVRRGFAWALPIGGLVLVPKCPACVAAYVMLFTGAGISLPVAAAARWVLIGVCGAAIVYLIVRGFTHSRRRLG